MKIPTSLLVAAAIVATPLAFVTSAQSVASPRPAQVGSAPAVRASFDLTFDASFVDLGIVEIGGVATGGVQVTNRTALPLQVDGLTVLGDATSWTVVPAGGATLPLVLAPGGSADLDVEFTALAAGPSFGGLTLVTATPASAPSVRFRAGAHDALGSEYRIDAGGPAIAVAGEQDWTADFGHQGGVVRPNATPWSAEGQVLSRQRSAATFSYTLPVPGTGLHEVELWFGEWEHTLAGERVFDVSLEGQVVKAGLDLAMEAGLGNLHVETFQVDVTDGTLDLDFVASAGAAAVAGVRVRAIGELTVTPDLHHFGAVEAGQSSSFDVTLANPGAYDVTIDALRLALGPSGFPADYSVLLDGVTYPGYNETITQLVDLTIPPGGIELATVTFAPVEERYDAITLEFNGAFGTRSVDFTGLGGHEGDPFLHVVIDTPRVNIDYDGDGLKDVLLEGSLSHTHEPGHAITGWEWEIDGTPTSTLPTDVATLGLGTYTIDLTITDDNLPVRSLSGSAEVIVETPERVPGVLALYYDASSVGPAAMIDALPATADFAEVLDSTYVPPGSTIGGSSFDEDVVVSLDTRLFFAHSDTFVILPIGGAQKRLWVDGNQVFGPIALTSGEHEIRMLFAVNDVTELPLAVQVLRNGQTYPVSDLRHDQTALAPVINSLPPVGSVLGGNQIVLRGLGFFPSAQVTVNWGAQTLTRGDFTSIGPNELRFPSPAHAAGTIQVSVTTPQGTSNVRDYEYDVDGPVAMDFWTKQILPLDDPTAGTWAKDGRFYATSLTGEITAFTFDADYNLLSRTTYPGVSGLTNPDTCGITVNPWDAPAGPVRLYVSHARHYVNGGESFPEFSPYTGQVSVLEGPDFDTPVPLITNLPTSNHDHSIFAISFDNHGALLINCGGNTNAGVPHPAAGNLPESPLSGTVLRAELHRPTFDGTIQYLDPVQHTLDLDQLNGHESVLPSDPDVTFLATGIRNPFDHVFTTWGSLYTTDNGPNTDFGPASTGMTTQGPDPQGEDELILVERGNYYGHPNRSRARFDPRQAQFHGQSGPSVPGTFSQSLLELQSSTNGLIEYRADTFRGQLRGDLLAQTWYSWIQRIQLAGHRRAVVALDETFQWTGGLALAEGFGGTILALDYNNDGLRVLVPVDPTATGLVVYDIWPWRAPAVGGTPFTIGGKGFGTLQNTSVTIGGKPAVLTEVSATRIRGLVPSTAAPTTDLLDVEVAVGAAIDVHEHAFRYLLDPGTEPLVREALEAPAVASGASVGGVVGQTLLVVGDGTAATQRYDLFGRAWLPDGAARTYGGAGHAAAVHDGKLLLFGGDTMPGKVQIYDPSLDSWSAGTDMPWAATEAFAATVGDVVLVGGGLESGLPSSSFAVYDPVTDAWGALAALPVAVHGASAGVSGTQLYVFGGDDGTGATDHVQRFDSIALTWESSGALELDPLPSPRAHAGSAPYYFGEFHLAGGVDGTGTPIDTVDVLDPADDQAWVWRAERPLSESRSHLLVERLEAFVYAVGGRASGGDSLAFDAFRE